MTTIEIANVRKLPRHEKLLMMETLWEDLSREDEEIESPDWHRQALEETQQQITAGKAAILDWSEAKQKLRARFE